MRAFVAGTTESRRVRSSSLFGVPRHRRLADQAGIIFVKSSTHNRAGRSCRHRLTLTRPMKSRPRLHLPFAGLLLAWLLPLVAHAQSSLVFDTTGLPNGYYHLISSPGELAAQRFTTAASGPLTLELVSLSLTNTSGAWTPLVHIVADESGTPGTTLLGTLSSDSGVLPNGSSGMFSFSGSVSLAASTSYWVTFDANDAAQVYVSYQNGSSGGVGTWLTTADYDSAGYFDGIWYGAGSLGDPMSMTIYATASAIPEPSTYAALAGLGSLGLALWRRRSVALQRGA